MWGFIGNISLVLFALLVSILLDRYSEVYLTVLTAVGSVWGGIIGAVVAFYFTKRREETGE